MEQWPYQPYYCEENIWHLCRLRRDEEADRPGDDESERRVLLLSNPSKTCALWAQRAASTPEQPVVWDYHVVMLERRGSSCVIWDFDTRLETPVALESWLQATFPRRAQVPERFEPLCRCVEAEDYLELFSSDRSHMLDETGAWRAEPPPWERIYDLERGMNLDRWLDMRFDFAGRVLELDELFEQIPSDREGGTSC